MVAILTLLRRRGGGGEEYYTFLRDTLLPFSRSCGGCGFWFTCERIVLLSALLSVPLFLSFRMHTIPCHTGPGHLTLLSGTIINHSSQPIQQQKRGIHRRKTKRALSLCGTFLLLRAVGATMPEQQHAVLVTGLPAEGVTETDVRQFMTFCGGIDAIHLFHAEHMRASSPSLTPSSTALVCFKHASSVGYAELLSGSLFQGKVIHIERPTHKEEGEGKEREDAVNAKTALVGANGDKYGDPSTAAGADGFDATDEAVPETMTGLWMRARMQRAATAMRSKADQLVSGAREQVAKVKQGALSLELRATHVVHNVREMREYVPVYGNGPTRAQYDYTPTQPQWGEKPTWLREPCRP
jgi:hypothetical protein